MKMWEVSAIPFAVKFKRIVEKEYMIFEPEHGGLEWASGASIGKPVKITKFLMSADDFEIDCPHPLKEVEASVNRTAYLGFEIRCKICKEEVEIDKLKTKRKVPVQSLPVFDPPVAKHPFSELSDEEKKKIHEFIQETIK